MPRSPLKDIKRDADGYPILYPENIKRHKEKSVKHHPKLTKEERKKQLEEIDPYEMPTEIMELRRHPELGMPIITAEDESGGTDIELVKKENLSEWRKIAIARMKTALVENYGNVSKALEQCNMDRKSHISLMKNSKNYAEFVADLNEAILDNAESALLDLCTQRNIQAVLFTHKTKGKSRGYTEQVNIELNGDIRFDVARSKPNELDAS